AHSIPQRWCARPAKTRAPALPKRRPASFAGCMTTRLIHGRRLEQKISHEWGSELAWSLFIPTTTTQTAPTFSENAALGFIRYLAYFNTYLPNFQLADLQFTVPSFWQTVQTSVYDAALDPDLTRFASHG